MRRLVIMTMGFTHSGKSTFAKALNRALLGSVVIDQDNHAEFIETYYQCLLPKDDPNTLKPAITQTIVNYSVFKTDLHLILSNSNIVPDDRRKWLDFYHSNGLYSILVYFDIPIDILQQRVSDSTRSTNILRSASNFQEVLRRQ
ncbi:MAG: AAA family ATPase [Tuberibacillus sp.]